MLSSISTLGLPPAVICGLLLASSITLLLLFSIVQAALSPLRSVPGPSLARYTRLWYLKALLNRDFHDTNIKLHRKEGPIIRIAPNQYSIDDPDAVKTIYGHGTSFVKSRWYLASTAPGPHHDLFVDPDPKNHAANRRKVAALYSTTNLLQFEPYVDTSIKIFMDRMHELSANDRIFDLQHWLQCYAFDVIGLISFNKRFGFLDEGDDQGLFEHLHKYLLYLSTVGIYNEFHSTFHWIKSKLETSGLQQIVDFASAQITDTIEQAKQDEKLAGRKDFAAKLLRMHWDNPSEFPMVKVFTMAITNVGAGSDTTSVSLAAIMYHLIANPTCYHKLRTEIDDAVAAGKISSPIQYNEAQALPYLQACIKEGLRMHPATGLPLERVVPPGGATIAGTYFPAGAVVGINTWVAHHNRDVFGPDAASFNPDRWLISDKARLTRMDGYYIPFGIGSRTCIGRNISLLEIAKLVPELVRHFTFELPQPGGTFQLELENLWFVKQKNFLVRVAGRG